MGLWPATWFRALGLRCESEEEDDSSRVNFWGGESCEGFELSIEALRTAGHQTSPCSVPPSGRLMQILSLEKREEKRLSAFAAPQTLQKDDLESEMPILSNIG